MRSPKHRIDGVLLLDKPSGISSNAALQRARRAYNALKAGHTGTLDPLASGLLPLCFGEATKFAQILLDARKRYLATVCFGVTTTTQDAEGDVVASKPVALTREAIEVVLPEFTGAIEQVPPAHSALKRDGRKYYEYARAGQEIQRVARTVEVDAIRLVDWTLPRATIDVTCGKGTYIRALAADLGVRLGCGAHLAALRRTATGPFDVTDAIGLAELESADEATRATRLLPPASLLGDVPRVTLDGGSAQRFRHGIAIDVDAPDAEACAVYCGQAFLGLARVADGIARPRRLVAESSG
ncbi:MAG TPA: tRNA pseudouridine(55) synthase TruB [Casimicrobiaceae bacterium]|nr:tRNA pseudouridine(55) synthase TruB [Casimicrobiaceae bacterium]